MFSTRFNTLTDKTLIMPAPSNYRLLENFFLTKCNLFQLRPFIRMERPTTRPEVSHEQSPERKMWRQTCWGQTFVYPIRFLYVRTWTYVSWRNTPKWHPKTLHFGASNLCVYRFTHKYLF